MLMRRHPINNRSQQQVLRQYVASVKEVGNIPGVRGQPWGVLSDGGDGRPYLMLTYGTLSAAVYIAASEDPQNPNVQMSIRNGIPGATLLHPRTPRDVLEWLRDWHNSFHSGSAISFIEILDKIIEVKAEWQVHCMKNGITVNSCGKGGELQYGKAMWTWIEQRFGKQVISSENVYVNGKILIGVLQKHKLYDKFKLLMCDITDFRNPQISNPAVIENMRAAVRVLSKKLSSTFSDMAEFELVLFEIFKMVTPHGNEKTSHSVRRMPWLFAKETVSACTAKTMRCAFTSNNCVC